MVCEDVDKYFVINNDYVDENGLFSKQFICILCKAVEFELDLGEHLFKKHDIYNKQYVLNFSSVFFDLVSKLDFGKYKKIENLYECIVCNSKHITKTLNHIKKHPEKINFVEMNVTKFQCGFCHNYLIDDIIEKHLKIKHNIPEYIFEIK